MRTALFAAATTLALSMPALADDIAANQGHAVSLGGVNGSVYYTETAGEFEVVATLSAEDSQRPIRTRANLRDGQSMTVEVPGQANSEAEFVTIKRSGDTLSIAKKPDLRASLIAE
ncbi:hypothetical protein FP2506_04606 [Fulvimarina pelagi HTCC2506]|uniref:Uncharacterized protein n=2 Tax=Fulvimarina pelagi TaxID=217511 RepID=Q0FZW1_9HYPH|nr:hypothetical protein [Fulvimarina pelagi]EAU40480.1 hypothetical protein FP2506_04606 [Fulvimarina pelagi HTCC2506]BAT31506.1 hypothetical protein [Fulvimarina pelagi]